MEEERGDDGGDSLPQQEGMGSRVHLEGSMLARRRTLSLSESRGKEK